MVCGLVPPGRGHRVPWWTAAFGALCLAAFAPPPPAYGAIELPQGPSRDLVYGKCRTCHDLQYLQDSKGITRAQWDGILATMKTYGLEVSSQQRKQILDYLATYLGPNPPAKSAAKEAPEKSGKALFTSQCISCHQQNGQGQTGEFPPLAGNRDLYRSRLFPVYVLLNGLQGKITVEGAAYNGQMPSFSFLSDQDIANLVGYIRSAWGNEQHRPQGMAPVSAKDVSEARKRSLTPQQVHQYRSQHAP